MRLPPHWSRRRKLTRKSVPRRAVPTSNGTTGIGEKQAQPDKLDIGSYKGQEEAVSGNVAASSGSDKVGGSHGAGSSHNTYDGDDDNNVDDKENAAPFSMTTTTVSRATVSVEAAALAKMCSR
jgi:hypothetical protein